MYIPFRAEKVFALKKAGMLLQSAASGSQAFNCRLFSLTRLFEGFRPVSILGEVPDMLENSNSCSPPSSHHWTGPSMTVVSLLHPERPHHQPPTLHTLEHLSILISRDMEGNHFLWKLSSSDNPDAAYSPSSILPSELFLECIWKHSISATKFIICHDAHGSCMLGFFDSIACCLQFVKLHNFPPKVVLMRQKFDCVSCEGVRGCTRENLNDLVMVGREGTISVWCGGDDWTLPAAISLPSSHFQSQKVKSSASSKILSVQDAVGGRVNFVLADGCVVRVDARCVPSNSMVSSLFRLLRVWLPLHVVDLLYFHYLNSPSTTYVSEPPLPSKRYHAASTVFLHHAADSIEQSEWKRLESALLLCGHLSCRISPSSGGVDCQSRAHVQVGHHPALIWLPISAPTISNSLVVVEVCSKVESRLHDDLDLLFFTLHLFYEQNSVLFACEELVETLFLLAHVVGWLEYCDYYTRCHARLRFIRVELPDAASSIRQLICRDSLKPFLSRPPQYHLWRKDAFTKSHAPTTTFYKFYLNGVCSTPLKPHPSPNALDKNLNQTGRAYVKLHPPPPDHSTSLTIHLSSDNFGDAREISPGFDYLDDANELLPALDDLIYLLDSPSVVESVDVVNCGTQTLHQSEVHSDISVVCEIASHSSVSCFGHCTEFKFAPGSSRLVGN